MAGNIILHGFTNNPESFLKNADILFYQAEGIQYYYH